MRDLGERCGKHRMDRFLKREGIRSQTGYRRRSAGYRGKPTVVAPKHLNRQFTPDGPNQSGSPTSPSSAPTRGGCTWLWFWTRSHVKWLVRYAICDVCWHYIKQTLYQSAAGNSKRTKASVWREALVLGWWCRAACAALTRWNYPPASASEWLSHYCNKLNTDCDDWLACASIAVAACWMICALAKLVVSVA